MKTTMKIFLALAIFCTVGLAGDQSNGGRNCDPSQACEPTCTVNCGFAAIAGGEGMGDIYFGNVDTDLITMGFSF